MPGLIAYKVVVTGQTASLQGGVASQSHRHCRWQHARFADYRRRRIAGICAGVDRRHRRSCKSWVLRAFNALDGTEVYNSGAGGEDDLGMVPHYPPITCAPGGVFVDTARGFAYYAPVDPCKAEVDNVNALQDQLSTLADAFGSGEIPVPRTPQNVARVEAETAKLRRQLIALKRRSTLAARRTAEGVTRRLAGATGVQCHVVHQRGSVNGPP
jgi:hypothetical protein